MASDGTHVFVLGGCSKDARVDEISLIHVFDTSMYVHLPRRLVNFSGQPSKLRTQRISSTRIPSVTLSILMRRPPCTNLTAVTIGGKGPNVYQRCVIAHYVVYITCYERITWRSDCYGQQHTQPARKSSTSPGASAAPKILFIGDPRCFPSESAKRYPRCIGLPCLLADYSWANPRSEGSAIRTHGCE
jgi:hypothetical protein